MPSYRTILTDQNSPKSQQQQQQQRSVYIVKRNVNEIKEIPSENKETLCRRYLTRALIALAMIACLIIIGVTITLIVIFTRRSTSTTTTTTISTVSSTNSSTTSITTGSSTSISTSATGFSASGTVAAGTTAWYGYEDVSLSCSVNLINVTIIITVQKTVSATYSGAYSTFWGGPVNQGYVDTGSQIIYTWTIISGQTIYSSGSPYKVEAQFHLFGTNQLTTADTYQVTATTIGGVTSIVSGHF